MPFDEPKTPGEKTKRHPGLTAAAILYGLATIGCLALAGFMYWNQGRELLSVPVIAPLAGALWFVIRTVMVLGPNPYKIESQDK